MGLPTEQLPLASEDLICPMEDLVMEPLLQELIQVLMLMEMESPTLLLPITQLPLASEDLICPMEDLVMEPLLQELIQVLMLMEMESPTLPLPTPKSDHLSFMVEPLPHRQPMLLMDLD